MKKTLLVLAILLSGCATTSQRMNHLSIGMTKDQVIQAIGQPQSNSAQNNSEVFRYTFFPGNDGLFYDDTKPKREYFVRFVNGKAESFGEMGDFDSIKDPTITVNLNQKMTNAK